MFYKMISKKRDEWLASKDCTINRIIDYIINKNEMRDAQIEAIKTFLFLKISGRNRSLYELFCEGFFNTIEIEELEIKNSTKNFLLNNKSAAALFEYASLKDEEGNILSKKLIEKIKSEPAELDYKRIFNDLFYGVSYSDYLFSLPMGAGKTYLMAAFIYLDLYFASLEPDNKAFAHNFIVFAPSGLKTSVVPSLRTIQHFDPSWIIPEPAATELKRVLKFEVLDQNKSAKKSNKTKNPNAQKIANHQPLHELFGLVAVTNAEKVILDRIKVVDGQMSLLEDSDDEKDKQANELRNLLGKLPNISIYIDEVHHAATDDKKLRAVINQWMKNKTVNGVIGFSGTPYLQKAEKISILDKLSLSNTEISNIAYYYPLVDGIDNFLKRPKIKVSDSNNRLEIIDKGVREFFDTYKDTVYNNDTVAKLGIYCGNIETLEESVFPLVQRICEEYNINASESVLKFHGGNKEYSIPVDSQYQFESLDKPFSKIRIVLLVQIGKEGWDCKSLTGIILSQEGDCSTNMVLQTSCRCLRQAEKNKFETALIYLNQKNASILEKQLNQQHHITIKELEAGGKTLLSKLNRYDRTEYLRLPKIDFYQLKINYNTLVIENELNIKDEIIKSTENTIINATIIKEMEIKKGLEKVSIDTINSETGNQIANYNNWIYNIAKNSFGFVSIIQLKKYNTQLQKIYKEITYDNGGVICFSSKFNINLINENIRKAFYEKRYFETLEELIPEEAALLKLENFNNEISTDSVANFYPSQKVVANIILDDNGKLKLDSKTQEAIKLLEETGQHEIANTLRGNSFSHPMKNKSFHYLPYKTDSDFEQVFLDEVLKLSSVKEKKLEVYYNGDRHLTEFKIKCYKQNNKKLSYIGMYTPDFLIVQRENNKIYKIVIIETKGEIYANDPLFKDKKDFMQTLFKNKNNTKFGYDKFEYLYLEDTLSESDRILQTAGIIKEFFKEV